MELTEFMYTVPVCVPEKKECIQSVKLILTHGSVSDVYVNVCAQYVCFTFPCVSSISVVDKNIQMFQFLKFKMIFTDFEFVFFFVGTFMSHNLK